MNNYLLKTAPKKWLQCIMLCAILLCVQSVMAQSWENVGTQATVSAGGSSYNNLAIDASGNYYLSYYDTSVSKGSVQKFDGTTWSYLGGTAGITTGTATFNALAVDGTGNVFYSNQAGWPASGMEVRQFNGTAWSQLANVTANSVNYQAIGITSGNVVFAYNNENSGNVKRLVNGVWEQVGNTGFSGGASYAEMAVGTNNMVYTCNIAGGSAQVYQNTVTATATDAWTLVGGAVVGAASNSEQYTADIALDANNNIYVAYVSNSAGGQMLNVKKFNGVGWVQVGDANFSTGKTQHVALAVTANGVPFVVASRFENDNYLLNTVYRFDEASNTWAAYGGDFISDGQATFNDLIVDNANNYLVLAYSQSGTKVKRISTIPVCTNTEPGTTVGDTGCVTFTYLGQQVTYATVRAADGNIWLQQNLGSTAVATAVADEASYGDLFQWGRWDDGHQRRTSVITSTLPTPNNPTGVAAVDSYITNASGATPWWGGNALTDTWTAATPTAVSDTDGCDPCKALGAGWQMPTEAHWTAVVAAENMSNPATAFASTLKLPGTGYRSNTTGNFTFVGQRGYFWSSTTGNSGAKYLYVGTTIANPSSGSNRGQGAAVRCIRMLPAQVQQVEVGVLNSAPATITTTGGTLQLTATVTPATVSQNVTWSITTGATLATISESGLVTASANGSVTVRATSVQDTTKFGELTITLTNQSTGNGITGYNYDIIANGVGNASASSQLGLDEVNSRALVSLDFKATASSAAPTYGLPANGVINSANTTGVTYQLANYSGPNALYLTPSYVSGSSNSQSTGTLSFSAQNVEALYILSSAAGGGSTNLPFTATVNFADGTTQQSTQQAKDWYNNSEFAIKGIGRVNRTNNNLEGDAENPRLYENIITLTAANQTKTITGVTFSFAGDSSAEYGNEIRFAVLSITTGDAPQDVLTVETSGNAPATITTNSGTLMLSAYLNGSYTGNVTWTIVEGGTGNASVDIYGKVTAISNGTVTVRATQTTNPDLYGEIEITITGQQEGYCESYFVNGCSNLSITGVSTTGGVSNISNLASGCSNDNSLTGYGDFTAQSVVANPGNTISFTANFSTDTAYLSVWIDWNHDFVFADSERIYFTGNAELQSTTTFSVTVPQDALLGSTRIRFKAVNGWEGSGPCGYNSMGEVEDYTLTVAQNVAVTAVNVTTQNEVPATITAQNGTLQLVATVTPDNATNSNVTWSIVSGSEFATVNQNGVVTATANGTVVVRATSVADSTKFDDIEITISYTITVESITIAVENNAPATIATAGGTLQLVATVTPADATNANVTWSIVSGAEFATISEDGLVTAAGNGTVVVRATSDENDTIYDEIEITISYAIAIESLVVSVEGGAEPTISELNGTLQLVATVTPANTTNANVTWSIVSGAEFATISEDGIVTAIANGTVVIRATSDENDTVYDDIEIVIYIESLGLGDAELNSFSLYPNPVDGVLTLSSVQEIKLVRVYNQLGQLVKIVNTNTVDFTEIAAGVYLIEAEFGNNTTLVKKVIRK